MQNPILTLRHLVQEAALASTPSKRTEGIVSQVHEAMDVGVCSLYIADAEGALTLVATKGLNPQSVGTIRLRSGEGLVGRIAQTQHPLNVESASRHPDYRYFSESGEDRYEAFLGAPVVHAGELFGVLVVEQRERRRFSDEEESFLVTLAAHLGALNPADLQLEAAASSLPAGTAQLDRRFEGVSGSPGVGIGHIVLLTDGADLMAVADTETDDTQGELERFRQAADDTLMELAQSRRQLADSVSGDLAEVFTVYEMLLRGEDFTKEVERIIERGASAASALRSVVSGYAVHFEGMDDEYFRARSEDIRALGSRVYGHMCSSTRPGIHQGEKVVLVGDLISIADIATYPVDQVAGVVSSEGSSLSHTALLAKALGFPAVMGIGHHTDLLEDELAVVDGYQGQVLLSPSPTVRDEFERMIGDERSLHRELAKLKDEPAVTPDGARIRLLANHGLVADITPGLAHGAEGVGLYRSEIPFMIRDAFPSEDEQVEAYRAVLDAYRGAPVHMRTLDVGGDKPLPYYPLDEENPALGWRGVRFALDNSAIFMTQIRAMLRASVGLDTLRIMLPMVSSVAEVESFTELLDNASAQLSEEGVEIRRPRVGIMAEVPAVASILPFLEGQIDFVSIGSNDLSQYVLAVDRNNARVSALFDHLHPAVLQSVEDIAHRAAGLDLEVSVCGEMAADPCAAVLLVGMGIGTLSMPAFSIPRIKWLIRTVPQSKARRQLEIARRSAHPEVTRARLCEFLVAQGLGSLVAPRSAARSAETTRADDAL